MASSQSYTDQPWLQNDKWQTATIKSAFKMTLYVAWGFTVIWNLISIPLVFVVSREYVEKQNTAALVGLLFPLIGIGLLVWAIGQTREWRRFGDAPVKLDPFPGAIGGHTGGSIDIRMPFDSNARFKLTLTSFRSYRSGSGKNRRRERSAKWQDTQIARAEVGSIGTRVRFRFNVPAGLHESDASRRGDRYYLWGLKVEADLAGIDFNRHYEIPVFATGQQSRSIGERDAERVRSENEQFDDLAVAKVVQHRQGSHGTELYYRAGRNGVSALGGVVIGSIFAGIAWFIYRSDGLTLFASVFGAVGSLIVLGAVYAVSNSLRITGDFEHISSERRVFGIPVRKQKIRRSDFQRFLKKRASQTRAGNTHVLRYWVYAEDRHGEKILVGEGFKGDSEANAAIRVFSRELGLTLSEESKSASDEVNILASDD